MLVHRDVTREVWPEPGTWRPGSMGGVRTAFFRCPQCPTYGSLLGTHEIAADGKVTPSVQCPNCDFHTFIELEGWQLC